MTNGYYELFKEVKNRNKGLSDNKLHQRASEIWAKMSEEDKNVYKVMAKKSRGDVAKYTSHNVTVDTIDQLKAEHDAEEARESDYIKTLVEDAYTNNTLASTVFHVMSTNYYCIASSSNYVTCELTILPFSLEKGVMKGYHTLIKTHIPVGFNSDAMVRSKEHGIPTPPLSEGEDDLLKIMASILQVTKGSPIFCSPTHEKQVKSFINCMCKEFNKEDIDLPVYSLTKLFFKLRNTLTINGFPHISLAQQELDKDPFKFCMGMECWFHRTLPEHYYHCAMAVCKRWAFTICDYCCKELDIKLIPGLHIPKKETINFEEQGGTAALQVDIQATPEYRYEEPKAVEDIIKEENWPSIGQPSSSRGPTFRPRAPGSAWGPRPQAIPPAQSNMQDSKEWPDAATSMSQRGRRGRR